MDKANGHHQNIHQKCSSTILNTFNKSIRKCFTTFTGGKTEEYYEPLKTGVSNSRLRGPTSWWFFYLKNPVLPAAEKLEGFGTDVHFYTNLYGWIIISTHSIWDKEIVIRVNQNINIKTNAKDDSVTRTCSIDDWWPTGEEKWKSLRMQLMPKVLSLTPNSWVHKAETVHLLH